MTAICWQWIFRPGRRRRNQPIREYLPRSALGRPRALSRAAALWWSTTALKTALRPDFAAMRRVEGANAIATAPGRDGVDFVSRYFAPNYGVDEDPVTGSAHCVLTPYWAARLGNEQLTARQISARGGELICTLRGGRVTIAGHAVLYLEGAITI